jgi:SagB-type dehydrogenase family enzyme
MPPKILWVLLPLLGYAVAIAVLAWRRPPSRLALNVQTSLLLLVYLLTTASLGLFWVANQQLPVFDWHYLFGYATLLLVALHLVFNLPLVLHWLRQPRAKPAFPERQRSRRLALGKPLALAIALALAFFIGTRQGGGEPALQWRDTAPAGATTGATDAVIRYHEYSSQSRSSVFQRAPGVEWGEPPPVFKRYPERQHVALARGSPGGHALSDVLRTAAPRMQRLQLRELGEILYLAAGVTQRRGGNALRAAPSSGALFPSELYVLARTIDGLPAGLYHYDPQQHRLDLLGPAPSAAALGAPQAEGADALVLLSAIFRRTGYKYRNRAYRYAVADAGHLLENLRLAAHAAGMQARLLARFDEMRAASALGIDGVEEGVLGVMDLRQAAAGSTASPLVAPLTPVPPAADSAIGVTGMVQRATSLQLPPAPAVADSMVLPPPQPAARDLHDTILHRRSQRRFRAEPVPLAALSSLLSDIALPPQLSAAIRINLVVSRVAGLAPGVYRYLPPNQLQRVRGGDFAAAAQSAALSQDVIGDAAVVLVLSAEREALLAEGARGYRHGFLEAGMLGERWLLGAVARGLAACPVGAFYDDEAAALIGVDPHREWVLHFAALGWPAD